MLNDWVLCLLAILLLTGCAANPKRDYRFIANPEPINKLAEKKLTSSEVSFDVEQAQFALEHAYSGRRFLPGAEYTTLMNRLTAISGSATAGELCKTIDELMSDVSDNHLSASLDGVKCSEEGRSKHQGSVGHNFYTEQKDVPWKVDIEKQRGASALRISIVRFPKAENPVWVGFIDEVRRQLPHAHFVILDLRGNGGGDDSTGAALAALLAGGPLKTPYGVQWMGDSPESFQVMVNAFEFWARAKTDSGGAVPQYLSDLIREFKMKRDKALRGEKTELPVEPTRKDFEFAKSIRKPIYILIDAACGSSCESTIDFFEYNALVKTLGENTAGYIHFGNNGNVFLKNSGIRLQLATAYNTYVDGRFLEKKGISPKIKVPPGSDAMMYAWSDYAKSRATPNQQNNSSAK